MDAVILAAGKGTRMAPLCTKVPKPMLPLGGKPILQHLLERARAAGVTRAIIIVEYLAEAIESTLRAPEGMAVVFVRQGPPQGTGHAVAQAIPHVHADCLLFMGDSLVSTATLRRLVAGEGLIVAAAHVDDPRAYGVLEVDGDVITDLAEKPETPPSDLANTGFYRVTLEALQATADLQRSPRGELEFTDIIHAVASQGDATWIQADGWLDIGSPWQYLAAHETMLGQAIDERFAAGDTGAGTIEYGVHIHGRVYVDKDAIIKSGTYIEGDVRIGAGAVVGPNAYLRGPVDIGPGCKVGAASEIKNSILLAGGKAPHHNYVGDSILGHECNLGSGTKLANVKNTPKTIRVDWDGTLIDTGRRKFGSVIGDGAKTGINASLNPGTILAAGATVAAGGVGQGWIGPA